MAEPEGSAYRSEELAQVHRPDDRSPIYQRCRHCFERWPCDTFLLIEECRAERARAQSLANAVKAFRVFWEATVDRHEEIRLALDLFEACGLEEKSST